jgi:uncharacterized protein (DUF736 family)
MSYTNEPGTGALFKNEKDGKPNRPDYKGPFYERVGDEVVEREIAAWIKTSKKGTQYLSFRVRDKFVPAKREEKPAEPELNDDVPF